MTDAVEIPEFERQRGLLNVGVGEPGSGAVRYAAAMYFYNERMMSGEMLEIYRMCSKFDKEDPIMVAKYEGTEMDVLSNELMSGRAV